MPPLQPASDGEDAADAGLRNVAAGVTLADAVGALRALDAATPAGACAARAACATMALLVRADGTKCATLACVNCPRDAAKQAAASALGAEALLQRTLLAGGHDAGVVVCAAWALEALCACGHGAALAPATAAACAVALTGALKTHGRTEPLVALMVATTLAALFRSAAAAVHAAAQCDTAATLFQALQAAVFFREAHAAELAQHYTRLERLGDALMPLLDAQDGAGGRVVTDVGCFVTAADTTIAALHASLNTPHTATRFASVLAVLCDERPPARRAALASTHGGGAVRVVCVLLVAEPGQCAPVYALCALLQGDGAGAAAPLARALGAQAAVLDALRAQPGDAQLARSGVQCLYVLVGDDAARARAARARAARDAGAISLIAAAMHAHEGELAHDWPMLCSCVLCMVTQGSDDDHEEDEDDDMRAAEAEVDAADALVAARAVLHVLRTHAHLDVALTSCAMLLRNTWRPVGSGGGSAELARMHADAIGALSAALPRHAACVDAATSALSALALLISATPARPAAAPPLPPGVAAAAVAAMRAHAGNAAVQRHALDVLALLSMQQDASALLAAGVQLAAVAAVSAFPERQELCGSGMIVLLRTVSSAAGAHAAAAAVAAGVLEAAARVLRAHVAEEESDDERDLDESDVRVMACELLCDLICAQGAAAARGVARVPAARALTGEVARVVARVALAEARVDVCERAEELTTALTAALDTHDAQAAACADDGAGGVCVRCEEQRQEGARCGLTACGSRRRH
jgi:hypothetical protein